MEENKEGFNSSKEQKDESFIMRFIKKNIFALILILIIIIVFLYSIIRVNILERNHERETERLISEYEVKIDSLTIDNMKLTTRVFTWAVRSELIRQNKEQVDHFFSDFIREERVFKIKLIDPETHKVSLSTDKKDVGSIPDNIELFKVDELTVISEEDYTKFINPVMGLDRKVGILVIYMN